MKEDEYENSIDGLIEYADEDEDTAEGFIPELTEEQLPETEPPAYEEKEPEYEEDAPAYVENEPAYEEDEPGYDEEISEEGYDDDYDELIIRYEEKREEKKKPKKSGRILKGCLITVLTVIAVFTAVTAFMTINTGVIGTYKRNFSNNFTRLFGNLMPERKPRVNNTVKEEAGSVDVKIKYRSRVKGSDIVTLEHTENAVFAVYKEGIICASANHMTYINSDGEIAWDIDTAIVEPILSAEENYILLAEKGGSKLCLYADRKLVYDVDDPDNIVAAKVSARGDVIAVTDKASYRGGVSVYNKLGEQIYSWASGRDTVISADVSAVSRRAAVSLLNTETSVKSVIQFFDLNETQSYAQVEVPDTVIYDLRYTRGNLTAFGDNRLLVFAGNGSLISDNELGDVQITHSAMDVKGNKLLAVDDGNVPVLSTYKPNGEYEESMALGGVTDFIDINKNIIIYDIGRDIYFGRINAKTMTKYTATMDIQKLVLISKDTFVIVYSNSLEVITI